MKSPAPTSAGHAPPPQAARPAPLLIGAVLLALFAGFCALGVWQLQRLGWKRELIARVDSRIHADAAAAPARADWPQIGRARDEYRRIRLDGEYLAGRDTRVLAVTGYGRGYWVLSPLRTAGGEIVLVNRGFVPAGERAAPVPAGPVQVTGLLRVDEPGGGFLQRNRPGEERWYSRDVTAIAAARGLQPAAPYFVDAERTGAALSDGARVDNGRADEASTRAAAPRWPAAGMTVVRFRDNHLGYALTWFALAALVACAGWRLLSGERRLRQHVRVAVPAIHTDAGHAIRRD